jgi:hypothetical protein
MKDNNCMKRSAIRLLKLESSSKRRSERLRNNRLENISVHLPRKNEDSKRYRCNKGSSVNKDSRDYALR